MKNVSTLFVLLFLGLVITSTVFAYNGQLNASGNGVFVLQANDLPGVGGIQATIEYSDMEAPQVVQGSVISNAPGALFVKNTNIPGKIFIVAAQVNNEFKGTGPVATITFKTRPNVKGKATLTAFTAATEKGNIASAGNMSPSPVSDWLALDSSKSNSSTNTDSGNTTTTTTSDGGTTNITSGGSITTSGSTTYLGGVTMPGDTSKVANETPKNEPAPEQVQTQQAEEPVRTAAQQAEEPARTAAHEPEPIPATAPERTKPAGEKKFTAHKSLLDQFKEFKDEKTPKAMLALVSAYSVPGMVQEPPVALSDGTSVVKVRLDLPATGKESPNFALKGAKLVSLKNDEKDKWVIEALPAKNANDVRITALQGDVMTEIPLLVAQPLPANAVARDGKWDESAFAYLLKERGGEKDPKYDFNGDGVRNHIDDYIYTLNYAARNGLKQEKAVKPVSPKPEEKTGKEGAKPAKVK